MIEKSFLETLHNNFSDVIECERITFKKNSLNGKVIIIDDLVTKSIDLKREKLSLENEKNARINFPQQTLPLLAIWKNSDTGFIVYKKESAFIELGWRSWEYFMKNNLYKRLLIPEKIFSVNTERWFWELDTLFPITENKRMKVICDQIAEKISFARVGCHKQIKLTHCHGDLLPSNVIITKKLTAKLIDWTNGGLCPVFYDQLVPVFYGGKEKILSEQFIKKIQFLGRKFNIELSFVEAKSQIITSCCYYYKYNMFRHSVVNREQVNEGINVLNRVLRVL